MFDFFALSSQSIMGATANTLPRATSDDVLLLIMDGV
jgi:hypothetical protein